MQKTGFLALGLAASLAACGGAPEAEVEEEEPVDTGGVAATIISSGTGEDCTYSWDGQPITPDGILGRSVAVVNQAINDNGGVANMTEDDLPILRFEADADAPYHCTSIAIGVVRATGFTGGTLRMSGSNAEVNVLFEVAGFEGNPPRTIAALGENDEVQVSGRDVALEDLGSEIVAPPISDPIIGEGTLFLLPSANTRFDRVSAAAEAIFQGGGRATLASCYNPNFDNPFGGDQIGTPLPTCGGG